MIRERIEAGCVRSFDETFLIQPSQSWLGRCIKELY
jgi:hypothetical protein